MNTQNELLSDIIAELVEENDPLTFAELMSLVPPWFEIEGDWCIAFTNRPNAIIWAGVSEAFSRAVLELLNQGRVHAWSGTPQVYVNRGQVLDIPLGWSLSEEEYDTPHWLPMLLRPVPWTDDGVDLQTALAMGLQFD